MAEQKTQPKIEQKKVEEVGLPQREASKSKSDSKLVETKVETKPAVKEEKKTETKIEAKVEEKKAEVKKEEKKKEVKISKKDEAVARGLDIHASKKHCMYISKFIKGKSIDTAIYDLERVIKLKKIVPFKGEIPHRHGIGMMSGRYPVNASKLIIPILKGLKGNVLVNGMDLDKTKIYYASPSWASLPHKKGGARFKRVNITIKAKEFAEEPKKVKQEKKEPKQENKNEKQGVKK